MNENNIIHYYSETEVEWKDKKFTRKVAFAGIVKENHLRIGKSECSEKDNYDEKKGRKIAEGRAIKNPMVAVPIEKDIKIGDLFVKSVKQILENKIGEEWLIKE